MVAERKVWVLMLSMCKVLMVRAVNLKKNFCKTISFLKDDMVCLILMDQIRVEGVRLLTCWVLGSSFYSSGINFQGTVQT